MVKYMQESQIQSFFSKQIYIKKDAKWKWGVLNAKLSMEQK